MQQRHYPTAATVPHTSQQIDEHVRRETVQRAIAKVSPGLDRPGLDPAPVPEPALHLLGGIWIASCPTCGYQLTSARTQERCERRAARRRCPVCHEDL
jgi:NAD-dependent SIR2 family protein deacetylase